MSTFRQKVQATTSWVKPDPEDLAEPQKASLFARARFVKRDAEAETGAPSVSARGPRRRKSAPPPVTAHRLFPAFAAVWFAALFGLGSLAISSAVLGKLVLMTGLPALVPAAAPPLGFTAHVLVAFLLAAAGGVLGLGLGLRLRPRGERPERAAEPVAPPVAPEAGDIYKVRARDAHPDAPPRRPLVLTEAFAEPLEAASAEPEPPLLRTKPLQPGSEPADAGPWIPEFAPGGIRAVRPLDLSALDLADAADDEDAAAMDSEPDSPKLDSAEPIVADADAAELPVADAAPTLAPAAAPALIAATPQLPAGLASLLADRPSGQWSPVSGAPLENLGLVQLIERLALSIAAQKTAAPSAETAVTAEAACEPAPSAPAFEPGPFAAAQPGAVTASAGVPSEVPGIGSPREAILRRLGAIAAGESHADADPLPPFRRPESKAETVAIAAPAPFETDEALRSALATLQRMTARG